MDYALASGQQKEDCLLCQEQYSSSPFSDGSELQLEVKRLTHAIHLLALVLLSELGGRQSKHDCIPGLDVVSDRMASRRAASQLFLAASEGAASLYTVPSAAVTLKRNSSIFSEAPATCRTPSHIHLRYLPCFALRDYSVLAVKATLAFCMRLCINLQHCCI